MRHTEFPTAFVYQYRSDAIKTSEYYKAMQARADRCTAEIKAAKQKQGLVYTSTGDFCHLSRKGVSFARG